MKKKRGSRIKNIEELPTDVAKLPEYAQHIYLKAHNEALEHYKDPSRLGGETREEMAHKVAWESVREKYSKHGSKWIKKHA